MSGSALAVLIVPLTLALLAWWLDHQARSTQSTADLGESFFRVSHWIYGLFVACGSMCGAFIFWGFDKSQTQGAREMMLAIGFLGVSGSIAALWWYAKSTIRLTEDELIIEAPFSRKVVRFNQIKDVRVTGGMIVLDEGKIPRLVVPIIYRKTGLLLANIESRRFNRSQRPQA